MADIPLATSQQIGFWQRAAAGPWGWYALLLIAGLLYYTNLGVAALWDEDEPRNAACAAEMLARGDWVVPTFNGAYRTQKPVLLYWLQMVSYRVWGVNEFAARFPSATLTVATVFLAAWIGTLLHSRLVGLLGGLMLACAVMFTVAARASTPDGCLIFGVTLTLACYVRGCSIGTAGSFGVSGAFPTLRWNLAMYGAMGWSMLAKGPVGVLLPTAIIGLYTLFARAAVLSSPGETGIGAQLRGMVTAFPSAFVNLRPWWGAVLITAIAAPWYVLVHLRTDGVWTRTFFFFENIERFQKPMENHDGNPLYYAVAVLVGFFPWSIFLPLAVYRAARDARWIEFGNGARTLLLCWAGVWIGAFTTAQTKLPSYVLPAYPAVALLTAWLVRDWLVSARAIDRRLLLAAWGSYCVIGVALLIALPYALSRFIPLTPQYGLVGLPLLIAGILACIWYARRRKGGAIGWTAVGGGLFTLSLLAIAAPVVNKHQNTRDFLGEVRRLSTDYVQAAPRVASFRFAESSVIYYAGPGVTVTDDPAVIAQLFDDVEQTYVLTTAKEYETVLRDKLPGDVQVLKQAPRFMKHGEQAVLLGRLPRVAERFPQLQR